MVHCAKLLLKPPGWQWQPQLHRWGFGMENDFIPHSCLHSTGRNWYMPQRPESSNSNMFYNSQWIFSISVSRVFSMDILARRNELWPLSSSMTSCGLPQHYNGVTMAATASLITSLTIFYSKKTSKLRVTGLCAGNSPETGEFPAQMASNAENVSIWWCHHELQSQLLTLCYPVTSATLAAISWYSCVAIKCQREIPAGVSQL